MSRAAAGEIVGPLTIDTLANGGAGIGRVDGRVVFVPLTVPGDLVRCRLVRVKKRYADAELVEVLRPSPARREFPCPVAKDCGGCQWQQLPYAVQLQWKERLFHETLLRHCDVDRACLQPIVASPQEWGYRSRVQVKCYRAESGFVTGFFRAKSRYVVATETCPVMATQLNDLLALLRPVIAESSFAERVPQIDLAVGDDGVCRAVVHYLGSDHQQLTELLVPLAQNHKFHLAVQCGRKDSLEVLCGTGELALQVDEPPLQLNYAAGGFAQINLQQNRQLVAAVVAAANLQGTERVMDLYCGMGNFSLPLARRARSVTGVEDYRPSIRMARRNAQRNGIDSVDFHARPAEGALAEFGQREAFDLLLVDPPRAGAYEIMRELLAHPVKKVLYVSCYPQTLARDLEPLLHKGYRLVRSQPFDMFPQTHHVESLSVLEFHD